jgi:NADH-quinone oxidoreductase subunit C
MSEENKAPENETTSPEAPKTEEPKAEAPKAEAPKAEAPKAEAPKAEEKAVADAPVTAEKPAAAKPAPAPAAAAPKADAAPAPEPEPDPRLVEAQSRLETIKGKLVAKFGEGAVEEADVKKFTPTLLIKPEYWVDLIDYVKQDPSLKLNYPEMMAGTDYKDKGYFEVVVMLHSFELDWDVNFKVRSEREKASIPSITPLFEGLNWEEREIFDLLGIDFPGHPDMRRVMLEDDWKGHPLRKDYVVQD